MTRSGPLSSPSGRSILQVARFATHGYASRAPPAVLLNSSRRPSFGLQRGRENDFGHHLLLGIGLPCLSAPWRGAAEQAGVLAAASRPAPCTDRAHGATHGYRPCLLLGPSRAPGNPTPLPRLRGRLLRCCAEFFTPIFLGMHKLPMRSHSREIPEESCLLRGDPSTTSACLAREDQGFCAPAGQILHYGLRVCRMSGFVGNIALIHPKPSCYRSLGPYTRIGANIREHGRAVRRRGTPTLAGPVWLQVAFQRCELASHQRCDVEPACLPATTRWPCCSTRPAERASCDDLRRGICTGTGCSGWPVRPGRGACGVRPRCWPGSGAGPVTMVSARPGSGKTVLLRSRIAEAAPSGRVASVAVGGTNVIH